MVNLRKMAAPERKVELGRLLEELQPEVVFVDNLLHMESDFNDPVSSRKFVDYLLKLCDENNCVLVGVIHENKAQNDTNSKGHTGTMTDESCSDKFNVMKSEGSFTAVHTLSRDSSIDDIGFVIGENGLPMPALAAKELKKIKKAAEEKAEREKIFKSIFNEHMYGLSKPDLVAELKKNAGFEKSKAYKQIDIALEEETLVTTDDGLLIAPF